MSLGVQNYDPNQKSVYFTPAAIKHIKKEITKNQAKGLRLGVKKAGCSGFKYIVDLVYDIQKNDRVMTLENDLNIFIDSQNYAVFSGVIVDYVKEGLNGRLKFINPNEKGSCGCGESFNF